MYLRPNTGQFFVKGAQLHSPMGDIFDYVVSHVCILRIFAQLRDRPIEGNRYNIYSTTALFVVVQKIQ